MQNSKKELDQARLQILQAEVNGRLETYWAELPAHFSLDLSPHGLQALDYLREFSLRPGKRLRAVLAMTAYEMFGGRDHDVALDLAVVMELTQSYLLIVDDVMDQSERRRGGPTLQVQYRAVLDGPMDDTAVRDHNANMLGVNVGLLAQHLAASVLNSLAEAPARVLRAERLYHANVAATGFGQIDDLFQTATREGGVADTLHMYALKSAYYTFINPLQMGAALAGANEAALERLHTFGLRAGLAFQLHDDLLGMFGDDRQTGKSVLDDLREGKMTVLIRHALEHGSSVEKDVILQALGNPQLKMAEHRQVQKLLIKLGTRGHAQKLAEREVASALDVLHAQTAWPKDLAIWLEDLLRYVVAE